MLNIIRIAQADPQRRIRHWALCLTGLIVLAAAGMAVAQDEVEYSAEELQTLVGPIALYPDDLVAIVLPASTYPLQIVQAARLLDDLEDNPSLQPDPEWDNAVVALLNYPEALRLMNDDLDWTWALGEAVLAQQADVLDAIQDFRDQAYAAGNLRSDDRQIVTEADEVISIAPADPEVIYIPYYEPERVIVYQRAPVYHYYSAPYPVYYYPYPVGYHFYNDFFWGVTSAFSIGWHTHYVNVYHHSHFGHPYYNYSYYTPYYARRGVSININLNHQTHIWQPTHRLGARPDRHYRDRVTATREGYAQPAYRDQRRANVREGRAIGGRDQRATIGSRIDRDAASRGDQRVIGGTERARPTTKREYVRGTDATAAAADRATQAAAVARARAPRLQAERSGTRANVGAANGQRSLRPSGAIDRERSLRPSGAIDRSGNTNREVRGLGGVVARAPSRDTRAQARPSTPADRGTAAPSYRGDARRVSPQTRQAPRVMPQARQAPRSTAPQARSVAPQVRAAPRAVPAPTRKAESVARSYQSAPRQPAAQAPRARQSNGGMGSSRKAARAQSRQR